ncbi:SMP-30/gluconolactonase/LRE family protein [Egibacter rhizosphaerae]|uniref:SMP-30/gluconolactonase/LRE family protein n=1 Tax=Egibacter rhizosphaerae TaxID=1670831 RepID=UPI00197AEC8E|nr:SMP-30/gluconolactonase/LRE family protein [Egibacter rhizosphaerae]
MSAEIDAPEFHDLVGEEADVEQVATGFQFTEGPLWNGPGGYLLFSDMPDDTRRRWEPAGGVTVVKHPSNKCNGMTYEPDHSLIVCEHVTSALVRERSDGTHETLASHWDGRELNSPNDVIVADDGGILFTDPTFGRMPGVGEERPQELDFQGVFRVPPRGGPLQLLADDFDQPNGLCFSADESVLYVNDTTRAHIRAFDVEADGSLTNDRVFFDRIGRGVIEEGVPDGMKCDERGNVYVTGPGGIWVISPDAERLGVIHVPENVANLNWGEGGWRSLFITASTSLYRLRMRVAGNPLGYMRAA